MLGTVYNKTEVDHAVKADDLERYKRWVWNDGFRNGSCVATFSKSMRGFDAGDAAKVAQWSGLPCS